MTTVPTTYMANVQFGSPDQWIAFADRNPVFVERLDALKGVLDEVLNRSFNAAAPVDSVVFAAGHIAADDFIEILLLCGNAEAYGAEKLLRPLFERVVLMKYLSGHPEEVDAYVDYFWITQHKLANAIESTFKQGLVDPDRRKEIDEHYNLIKSNYPSRVSWTPKDMITLAREVGLDGLVVPCYYMPMEHAHPTVKGMLSRLATDAEGRVVPTERLQPERARRTLAAAHRLLLVVLETQVEHFGLDRGPFDRASSDFVDIWGAPSSE